MRGFTLIELMVLIAITGVVISVILAKINGNDDGSYCVAGYKFVYGANGTPRQIMDEYGKGIRCN